MKRVLSMLAGLLAVVGSMQAGSLDDIRQALEQSSVSQVQEKVYVHTDNQCYFVGDTLWYKAYVVRADNLTPTDMSRILYVELLTPDGLLVERQNIIVAPEGHTCGQFVLQDSLYSGYYELRAYTRWMLNFGVREHDYTTQETWKFYNRQMAADYYRLWDGLYSRVIPIYSKPDVAGDYDARRMYQRPKQRLQKPKKEELFVSFYPEGGHLVEGLQSRVAFEVVDQQGEAVTIKGCVKQGSQLLTDIQTTHLGRGVFTVTPSGKSLTAHFSWRGKNYSFSLPRAEKGGVVLTLDGSRLTLQGSGLNHGDSQGHLQGSGLVSDHQYAVSILCRGTLQHFAPLSLSDGHAVSLDLPLDSLPIGINNLTVFDRDGRILADRLFFAGISRLLDAGASRPSGGASRPSGGVSRPSGSVSSPSGGASSLSVGTGCAGAQSALIVPATPLSSTTTYSPYAPITVTLQTPAPHTTFSLSVRDTRTDEPTYNDGNLMTDLLLSSELRGFIAHPAYYFESDDAEHRRNLDLLMMVQGWRKYPWQELADTARQMRYEPEKTMTVSGAVYKMLGISEVDQDEVASWQKGVGKTGYSLTTTEPEEGEEEGTTELTMDLGSIGSVNDDLGINHGGLKREVLVEAEVVMDGEIVAGRQMTQDGGRFLFQIPPFYGKTFLNLKAYRERDSVKKSMVSRSDATVYREDAFADYYVKRDMPFPIFTRRYSYYENHAPEWEVTIDEDSLSELSMENDVHQLGNVNVKGRRRGRRAIDWNKPAFVRDAYDLYNDLTDYGLSFGKFDMRQFPLQVAKFLFGNMGRLNRQFNVDGRWNGITYWRNYQDMAGAVSNMDIAGADGLADAMRAPDQRRSPADIMKNLMLSRLQDIRVFTDYEPRNEDSTMVESLYSADATVEMVSIADDGKQLVYRDRHIFMQGFNMPAEFYQPDYSRRVPADPDASGSTEGSGSAADYRRTLYWNPNARSDDEGRFTATFYNNGKETRIKISAAGVTPDGCLLYSK